MKTNDLYPIFIKLDQVQTLIVGGGNVALEKVEFILRQAPLAKLRIVAPSFHPKLILLAIENTNIKISERVFQVEDLDRIKLLILATNNAELNREINRLALERNILINEVDQPDHCDFYTSAVLRKGPVKIAVSSNGVSPTLAKRLRDIIDSAIPEEIEDTAEFLNAARKNLEGDLASKIEVLNNLSEVLSVNPHNVYEGNGIISQPIYYN